MKRRSFLTLLGASAAASAWPLAARAQQASMPVVGVLASRGPGDEPYLLAAFRQGLKDMGYVEGQNTAIEYRFAEGQYERLPALAADLVRRQVTVIAALGTPTAPAAKAATATIPIVFTVGIDPVESGLIASLSRPGGNLTGVTGLGVELLPKRIELLRELLPRATVVAALINPTTTGAGAQSNDLKASARSLGLDLHLLSARAEQDFDAAFANVVQLRAGGLVISNDTFFRSSLARRPRRMPEKSLTGSA
jgi:putative ABC transport system substrate-binding protein